ncbi:hypothetical protein [Pseudomonas monteilii]|uniref:Type II secretion system protein GspC N-terminal domain-containing protein n=1 Tax=Pseudomonas monteilii TaxID=76759 RepID=A0A399LYJ0_9PSED|nr:hypothetical protein [Pseudomonas monteilii]RII74653.1 hypothetical protein D0894_25460 [Pseudomonas monteilii]
MAERVGQEQVAPAPTAQKPLPTATLALAFGYSAPVGQAASQAELVLKACFVPSLGHARALVASREGESLYRVGDRMPGGSVLRRIDVRSITLWDGEREQRLALPGSRANVFVQSGSPPVRGPASADSPRLLREVQ